jgi:hypothetical protein
MIVIECQVNIFFWLCNCKNMALFGWWWWYMFYTSLDQYFLLEFCKIASLLEQKCTGSHVSPLRHYPDFEPTSLCSYSFMRRSSQYHFYSLWSDPKSWPTILRGNHANFYSLWSDPKSWPTILRGNHANFYSLWSDPKSWPTILRGNHANFYCLWSDPKSWPTILRGNHANFYSTEVVKSKWRKNFDP